MKVLVTGHKGYIGAHLVKLLKKEGHEVTGVDIDIFEGCAWETITKVDTDLHKDIRDLSVEDLKGHDCVMHLAAISNDPMGNLAPQLTYSINREGSINLARLSKEAGVRRFLFSSSCSLYGKGENMDLDEKATLNPLSTYAESKIATEQALSEMADENFCPVYLRNATAYGDSPMLRIDLVVNNLLASALSFREIRIMSDGSPWRPLVHCKDIARAFIALMNAPREKVFNEAINIGDNNENYQVKDIVELVQKVMPECEAVFTGEVGQDPRDYRVNFDKLNRILPDFRLEYNVEKGIDELYQKYQQFGFSEKDFNGSQFVRLRVVEKKLDSLIKPE